jgi:hypothetical protein
MMDVVIPPPPTFNIRGRQTKAWDYLFGVCDLTKMERKRDPLLDAASCSIVLET